MSNQYSMKIYPAGRGREVYRNIEICGSSTLNQLCQVMNNAIAGITRVNFTGSSQ